MQAINNGPSPWNHDSTAYGLLARREQLKRESQKSEGESDWEATLRRFWERGKPDQYLFFGTP